MGNCTNHVLIEVVYRYLSFRIDSGPHLELNFREATPIPAVPFWCLGESLGLKYKGYRMNFASICKHANSAFIFASSSSEKFSHWSSEHFVDFPPAAISLIKTLFCAK